MRAADCLPWFLRTALALLLLVSHGLLVVLGLAVVGLRSLADDHLAAALGVSGRCADDHVDVIIGATAADPKGGCEMVVRKAPKADDSKSEDNQQAVADEKKQG